MALRDFDGSSGGKPSSQEMMLGSLWELVTDMTSGNEDILLHPNNQLIAASYIVGRSVNFELLAHITPSVDELEQTESTEEVIFEQAESHTENTINLSDLQIDLDECTDASDYTERVKNGIFAVTSGSKKVKIMFDEDGLDILVGEACTDNASQSKNIFSDYYKSQILSSEVESIVQQGITAARESRRFHNALSADRSKNPTAN